MNIEPVGLADPTHELQNIFTDPSFRISSPKLCKPNRLFLRDKDGKKTGGVIIRRNANGRGNDFALSKAALDYVVKRLKEGGIDDAYIVLGLREADGSVNVIACETATQVQETLRNVPSIAGDYGDYWWITRNFTVAGEVDDEVPF